jgi:hypothetical protein
MTRPAVRSRPVECPHGCSLATGAAISCGPARAVRATGRRHPPGGTTLRPIVEGTNQDRQTRSSSLRLQTTAIRLKVGLRRERPPTERNSNRN